MLQEKHKQAKSAGKARAWSKQQRDHKESTSKDLGERSSAAREYLRLARKITYMVVKLYRKRNWGNTTCARMANGNLTVKDYKEVLQVKKDVLKTCSWWHMHSGHVVGRGQLARQDDMALRITKDLSTESSSRRNSVNTEANESAKAAWTRDITTKVAEASGTSIWNGLNLESIHEERMSCQSK